MEIAPFIAPSFVEKVIEKKDFSDKVALIDADFLKYYVSSQMYYEIMNEGEPHSISLVEEKIKFYLEREFFERFSAKAYLFCFSCPRAKVFRNHIAQDKQYKGNRIGQKDYTFYEQKYEDMAYVFEFISKRYPTLIFDDLEADDIVSFLQGEETFIYSKDKDLLQVNGFHYDEEKHELIYVSEEEGLKTLLYQILLGDTSDNFGGLPGFGKVSLEKFMKETKDVPSEQLYHMVIKMFTDKLGLRHGIDQFNEMWLIATTLINRGSHFKQKYLRAFETLNMLLC